MPFPFLDLPPELRTKILLLLLHHPTPIALEHPQNPTLPQTYPHALLLTCAQLYTEALSLYYSTNTILLTLHRHNERGLLPQFLSSSSRHLIRSLKVHISRWGANDYFVKAFAPAIEELILKGGLRRLEFVLSEGYVGRLEQGAQGKDWRCLKRLLRDPYLECARLWAGRGGLPWFEGEGRDVSWLIWE